MENHNHGDESVGFTPRPEQAKRPVLTDKPISIRKADNNLRPRDILTCCLTVLVLSVLGVVGGVSYVWYSCSGGLNEEVDVEVVNVPKDARFVCVGGGNGDGVLFSYVGEFRVFQGRLIRTPERDVYRPNFAAEIDGDVCLLKHREWQDVSEYAIIVEDQRGNWRVWQVKKSAVSKRGRTVRFTVPDRPPEGRPFYWERRLDNDFPKSVRGVVESDEVKDKTKP